MADLANGTAESCKEKGAKSAVGGLLHYMSTTLSIWLDKFMFRKFSKFGCGPIGGAMTKFFLNKIIVLEFFYVSFPK